MLSLHWRKDKINSVLTLSCPLPFLLSCLASCVHLIHNVHSPSPFSSFVPCFLCVFCALSVLVRSLSSPLPSPTQLWPQFAHSKFHTSRTNLRDLYNSANPSSWQIPEVSSDQHNSILHHARKSTFDISHLTSRRSSSKSLCSTLTGGQLSIFVHLFCWWTTKTLSWTADKSTVHICTSYTLTQYVFFFLGFLFVLEANFPVFLWGSSGTAVSQLKLHQVVNCIKRSTRFLLYFLYNTTAKQ